MNVFRFKLSANGIDDSFYFSNHPARADILAAMFENKSRAGKDWEFLYNEFEDMINSIEPEEFYKIGQSGSLCGIGGKVRGGIWSIDRFKVIEII